MPIIGLQPAEAALLEEIRARPDDDAPRLVYADWLTQRGDPHGELIMRQCTRARTSARQTRTRARLQLQITQLLAEQPGWVTNLTRCTPPMAGPTPAAPSRALFANVHLQLTSTVPVDRLVARNLVGNCCPTDPGPTDGGRTQRRKQRQ